MAKQKVRRPKREYSEKEIKQLERKNQAIGVERCAMLFTQALAEDYGFTAEQTEQLHKDVMRRSQYVLDKALRLADVASSIENFNGLRYDLFLGKEGRNG